MTEPLVISFEGLDGSGKTTQVRGLFDYYTSQDKNVTVLSSPSRTQLGMFIRSNFLSLDPWLKDRLFALDIHNSQRLIDRKSDIVFWDRHIDSMYSSNKETTLADLDEMAHILRPPHRTFLLDISPELSWQREGKASDHPLSIEWLKMKFERYQELMHKFSGRYFKIDASKPENSVFGSLVAKITEDLLRLKGEI